VQWKTTRSPRPKKAQMSKSKIKTMLIVFFDIQGIMTQQVPPGQTMNQTYYIELLTKLRGKIRRKRPELWKNGWILHQDNTPRTVHYRFDSFWQKKKQVPVLHHAPYSPDLAPCDFFLFPKLKHSLKGTYFQSIEDIQRKNDGFTKRVHTK
jgi:histone-lysine N-methyltransferase SETMAR